MSQQSIDCNEDLSALLLFQDNFLSLVHSQLFRKQQPFAEVFLSFEIHQISEANEKFNRMVRVLTAQLVEQKLSYELNLRDSFQRLLQADFLPLLRINRYELSRLALYGFDIYVQPLEAVLQILSRLEVSKKRVLESQVELHGANSPESALEQGWEVYSQYLQQWRISFNLYILQEYLRVGGKSFLKKDREILFTGISNLYAQLVPALSSRRNFKLLKELAELNNALYHFHQSFNYFHFYTFLLPLQPHHQPIFHLMKEILEKCLRTNILTPLLFGILRHRECFLAFIEEADSQIWLPYLNAIIGGIAINLKFRILEYEEILEVFQKAASKAGMLGKLDTQYVFGSLDDEWKEAKDFFISAVKVGFSSGEVQVWKAVQLEDIGRRVVSSVVSGMLLNIEQNSEVEQYLESADEKLQQELKRLGDGRIDRSVLKTGIWQYEKGVQNEEQLLSLVRVLNLLTILDQINEYSLHFVISNLANIYFQPKPLLQKLMGNCIKKVNQLVNSVVCQESNFIKDSLIAFHKKYPPQQQLDSIITLYIKCYQPKKCLIHLLQILPISTPQCRTQLAESVSQSFLKNKSDKFIKIRTFQREFVVKACLVNPSYETHSVFSVLISQITSTQPEQRKDAVVQLLRELAARNPWAGFCLLNFPVTTNNKISSFSSFLIDNQQHHELLKSILVDSKASVLSQQGEDLIQVLCYSNISEYLCKKINEADQSTLLYPFMKLLLWVLEQTDERDSLCKDLLTTYLYLLQKTTNLQYLKCIISDISKLSLLAFGQKLQSWLTFQFIKRIEDKFDLQRINRRKLLKTQKSCVYFLNDLKAETEFNNDCKTAKQVKQKQAISLTDKSNCFWQIMAKLQKLNEEQLLGLIQNENVTQMQELKNFYIPTVAQQLVAEAFAQATSPTQENKALHFIMLNTENYLQVFSIAMSKEDVEFLKQTRLTIRLAPKIGQCLQLQYEKKVNFLREMCLCLSPRERQRIAQSFYFQWSFLRHYIENVQGIEFLAILNTSNWRVLIEFLSKQSSSLNLPSLLLQYRQYLSITSQVNAQYESALSQQSMLFHRYVRLFTSKFQAVFKESSSEEQLQVKCAHELCSLNLAIASFQLKQITLKLAWLHKEMIQRNIPFAHSWISDLAELNSTINNHIRGKPVIPNFSQGFALTNQQVISKYKVQTGLFLENYFQVIEKNCQLTFYEPKKLQKVSLQDLSQEKMTILDKSLTCVEEGQQEMLSVLAQKGCILKGSKSWQLNYETMNDDQQSLNSFYKLGCLVGLKEMERKQCIIPQLLRQLLKRQRLSWQVIKLVSPETFHFIKAILVDHQMAGRQLYFVYEQDQLIKDGKTVKVNDYNKIAYCQKVAWKSIGSKTLNCAKYFFQGYINQASNL